MSFSVLMLLSLLLRDSATNARGGLLLIGGYVLVDPKEVIGIVFSLNFHETVIVVSLVRFDPILSFLHHKVYIGTPRL
jgi:hypothetical protein